MRFPCVLSVPVVLAVMAAPSLARAQSGFALDHFDPADRGSDWFTADSLDLRGNLRPAVGITGDYAYRPLAIYNGDGSVRTSLVENQLFAHVGGSLVLFDRLRLGVSVPVALYGSGSDGTLAGTSYSPPADTTAVGDVRIDADVRLFGRYGGPVQVAIGAQVFAPSGSAADYTGDGSVRVQPRVLVAGDVASFAYSGWAAFQYRGISDDLAGAAIGSNVTLGAAAGVRLAHRRLLVGPEVWATAVVSDSSQILQTRTTPVEGVIGAHYDVTRDWRLGLGAGGGLTRGFGAPLVRGLLSVDWAPAYDGDGDGIADEDDACPAQPGPRARNPQTNGCPPPPPPDADGDGIPDAQDACASVAGVRTDDPKTNGCPPPPPDKDGDGVLDAQDACPDVPGVKTDDPKTNGCPDKDGDGIPDAQDACPTVKGVKTDDPKTNGCPPNPDRDGDGIPNEADACPDEKGPPSKDPKKNGCPQVSLTSQQIVIHEQVKFATGSARILPASDDLLSAVAKVLKEHAEIKKISIEGHTDNVGKPGMNQKLSTARAASVAAWLVKHGIDKARLTSIGYGQDKPIDTNDTDEGRQNNRRVEFHIVHHGE